MWRKPPCFAISRSSVSSPRWPKGGVAEVVGERNRLGEVFVEAERTGERPGDAGDLDGVGHPGPVMVAGAVEEDLGLVFEPAEGAAVDDPVAVALEDGAEGVLVLGWARPREAALLCAQGARWRASLFSKSWRRRGIPPNCHQPARDSTESCGKL